MMEDGLGRRLWCIHHMQHFVYCMHALTTRTQTHMHGTKCIPSTHPAGGMWVQ